MSDETTLYGCIIGPGAIGPRMNEIYARNKQAIESLPVSVSPGSAELMRSFFTVPLPGFWGFYRHQMIHFGASYNHIALYWTKWLQHFENLLRTMYWSEANLHLDSGLLGCYDYNWKAELQPLFELPPRPVENCAFAGGPRSFPI